MHISAVSVSIRASDVQCNSWLAGATNDGRIRPERGHRKFEFYHNLPLDMCDVTSGLMIVNSDHNLARLVFDSVRYERLQCS